MASSEPDSSPMAHICSTITGKTPVACIEVVSAEPVETSFWIFSVASAKTALPEAPPTESSASTSGTPAANIVESVRVQRAIDDLLTRSPKTGMRSSNRSMNFCIFTERRHDCMKKSLPPPRQPQIRYQYEVKNFDIAMTTSVGVGRSAPKDLNTSSNAGMTKI